MGAREMTYEMTPLVQEAAIQDRAAGMAFFLLHNVGSIFGRWIGRMSYADQRALFGEVVGKGRIFILGDEEAVHMSITTGFGGQDRDIVWTKRWMAFA